MTVFTLQNQVALKVLALLTMLMMVASLVPASVRAETLEDDAELLIDGVFAGEQVPDESQTIGLIFDIDDESQDEAVGVPGDENEVLESQSQTPRPIDEEEDGARTVIICHATENEVESYTQHEVSKWLITKPMNIYKNDIIPPFERRYLPDYPGKNWDDEGQAIWNNDCNIPEPEITVVATKLVCENELDLPRYGNGGPAMTADTATDWVEQSEGACSFQNDWDFQWVDQSGSEVAGDFIGESEDYTTFENSTDENGVTSQVISIHDVSELKLREVLTENYLPFSGNENDASAEFYCADDVLNYDNYDIIRNPEAGETYYCVAWNVATEEPEEPEVPVCKMGENLIQNGSFEIETVTDHGGQWEIFSAVTGWLIGLSDGLEIWNDFDGIDAGLASDGNQNVELDGNNATNISQSITTVPGATYELKFDYSARAGIALADSKMDTLINGVSMLLLNTDGSAASTNNWEANALSFVATGGTTVISFEDVGTPNADGGYGPLLDNVSLCMTKKAAPVCSLTIKSDVTDYVVEKNAAAKLLSYIHPSWVTTISTSTAAWIWGDNPVVDPLLNETQTFKKSFNWTGGVVTSATLKLASDNSHAVTLGTFTGGNPGEFNYGAVTSYNVASGVVSGLNTIAVAVENFAQANGTQTSNPAGLIYELTITGTGASCGTVVPEIPKTSGTVTMCKVDDNEEPLQGWTMTLLGDKVEDMVVPTTNSSGVNSVNQFNAGNSYVAVASGAWMNQGGANQVDSEYSSTDSWVTHMDGYTGYQNDILELQINGTFDPNSNWGAYNSAHMYAQSFVPAATGTTNLRIFDGTGTAVQEGWYGDNSGTLPVSLFEGFAGITGNNGCVTFTDVPFGEYEAGEIMQDGWEHVTGAGEVTISSANTPKTITIVNKEVDGEDSDPETYIVTGFKWNDVDGDGVYDDGEVKLPNWAITAVQGETIVSTTTDEFGNYTLVLPYDEGVWVVSETLQSGWTQTGLYKNGEKVTLGSEVSNNCSFALGSVTPTATCDFGNNQNVVVTDEPEPTNNRGGGGSGTRVGKRATPQGLVLGAATGTPACGMYLQDYMRMGNAASTTQVTNLQVFLNAVGINAPLTGIFDAATDAAVRTFQAQHKAEVLTPWYRAKIVPHENPTGWVYQLTRWKINNIVCPGSEAYPILN